MEEHTNLPFSISTDSLSGRDRQTFYTWTSLSMARYHNWEVRKKQKTSPEAMFLHTMTMVKIAFSSQCLSELAMLFFSYVGPQWACNCCRTHRPQCHPRQHASPLQASHTTAHWQQFRDNRISISAYAGGSQSTNRTPKQTPIQIQVRNPILNLGGVRPQWYPMSHHVINKYVVLNIFHADCAFTASSVFWQIKTLFKSCRHINILSLDHTNQARCF